MRTNRVVRRLLQANAQPSRTVDPGAPLGDLAPLRRAIGSATIVGLGESTHGAREETLLKHRVLRHLVEERGFRSIAWEDDWTLGLQLNRYILTGDGDLHALIGQMSTAWRSQEVADVLRWLRRYNERHRDKVRFVGVEFFSTRHVAYDAVADHVAEVAPEQATRPRLRRSALLVAVIASALCLAGCASETPGDATPGDTGNGGSLPSFPEGTETETTTEPSEEPGSGTEDLEPCELLSAQDLAALGLPDEPDEQDIGPARSCQWQASGSHTVTIGVMDALSIGDVVSATTPQPKDVGSHQAVQYTDGAGLCAIAMPVTDSSRVDVSGVAGGDDAKACDVANQAAELIEPKLP
jgi:hypothetical protein